MVRRNLALKRKSIKSEDTIDIKPDMDMTFKQLLNALQKIERLSKEIGVLPKVQVSINNLTQRINDLAQKLADYGNQITERVTDYDRQIGDKLDEINILKKNEVASLVDEVFRLADELEKTKTEDTKLAQDIASGLKELREKVEPFIHQQNTDSTLIPQQDLDMRGHKISEVGDPSEEKDATNKKYVDSRQRVIYQGGGGGISLNDAKAIKLDDFASPDDNTDLNASASVHGLLPKLENSGTKYLKDTGSWDTPSGGLANVVEDLSPQLGGDLDVNGNDILLGANKLKASTLYLVEHLANYYLSAKLISSDALKGFLGNIFAFSACLSAQAAVTYIDAYTTDASYLYGRAKDSGVGLVEIWRMVGAADPYFQLTLPARFLPIATASLPGTPVEGMVTYDATLDALVVYNGALWLRLATTADDVTGQVTVASGTAQGKVELATAAETTTGTDATRAVTPDGLAGSDYGKRPMLIKLIDDATALTTGDGKFIFVVPALLNGWNLVGVEAHVTTVSSSGTPTYSIYNLTDSQDMLSTSITIDANEYTSATAATPPVINTSYDDVATGDRIEINKDVAGTGEKGDECILIFQLP